MAALKARWHSNIPTAPASMNCTRNNCRNWSAFAIPMQESTTKEMNRSLHRSQPSPLLRRDARALSVSIKSKRGSGFSTHEPCLFRETFQRVVPANAGTHTARNLVLALEQRPFFTFEARGDGSLRSQGRPAESLCET